jgi:hypothetical protein
MFAPCSDTNYRPGLAGGLTAPAGPGHFRFPRIFRFEMMIARGLGPSAA